MKFYPADWRSDAMLRLCSIGARGLWAEMMCIMHDAERYGSLLVNGRRIDKKQLAGLAGVSEKECIAHLLELEGNGVFSRDEDGTIYSRRMRRDFEKAVKDKENGKGGGHPELRRGTVPKDQRVRRFRRSDAPEKAKRIFAKSRGHCHWCQKALDPDGYHIDHVIAVRDGGTNDENNLVAACPDCNGERAMTWGRNDSDLRVGNQSDHKAQKPEARFDDDGDTRAKPLVSPEAQALADELLVIAGHSLAFVPPGWCGAAMRVQAWLSNGWAPEVITAAVRAAAGRKKGAPAGRVEYFENAVAEEVARQSAPLPQVQIREAETLTVTHGTSQNRRGSSLIDALDRRIAEAELAEKPDPALPAGPVLRISH